MPFCHKILYYHNVVLCIIGPPRDFSTLKFDLLDIFYFSFIFTRRGFQRLKVFTLDTNFLREVSGLDEEDSYYCIPLWLYFSYYFSEYYPIYGDARLILVTYNVQ